MGRKRALKPGMNTNGHGKQPPHDDELAMPVSLSPALSRKRERGARIRFASFTLMRRGKQGWAAFCPTRRTLGALLAASLWLTAFSAAAHEFAFKDTHGQEQRLSNYRGKWVLVNFWATWCPPCLEEIPDLISLHNAHKDADLVVIGIALDYSSSKGVLEFAEQHAVSYPIVLGTHKTAEQVGEVDTLPTTYLFDPSGKPVSRQEGAITRDSVEEYIRSKGKASDKK